MLPMTGWRLTKECKNESAVADIELGGCPKMEEATAKPILGQPPSGPSSLNLYVIAAHLFRLLP